MQLWYRGKKTQIYCGCCKGALYINQVIEVTHLVVLLPLLFLQQHPHGLEVISGEAGYFRVTINGFYFVAPLITLLGQYFRKTEEILGTMLLEFSQRGVMPKQVESLARLMVNMFLLAPILVRMFL